MLLLRNFDFDKSKLFKYVFEDYLLSNLMLPVLEFGYILCLRQWKKIELCVSQLTSWDLHAKKFCFIFFLFYF